MNITVKVRYLNFVESTVML